MKFILLQWKRKTKIKWNGRHQLQLQHIIHRFSIDRINININIKIKNYLPILSTQYHQSYAILYEKLFNFILLCWKKFIVRLLYYKKCLNLIKTIKVFFDHYNGLDFNVFFHNKNFWICCYCYCHSDQDKSEKKKWSCVR